VGYGNAERLVQLADYQCARRSSAHRLRLVEEGYLCNFFRNLVR
jgi:hypothetical protein